MNFHSFVRKAAELVVELPPEEPGTKRPEADEASSNAGLAPDSVWAELEKAAQKPAGNAAPTKSVGQIVRDTHGPNLDQIKLDPDSAASIAGADGSVNFQSIYQAAGLPSVPFTSEQILDMLAALPAEIPLDTRRQMMKVSLNSMGKAIGATPENIVADASRKLAALAAYTDHLSQSTAEYTNLSEQKIALLQEQIEQTRKAMDSAKEKLARETQACASESHRLDDVLEFFSLDVPPSKYAPPQSQPSS